MPNPLETVLHHSEPIDPTLWEWLSLKIDDVLGLHSSAMVLSWDSNGIVSCGSNVACLAQTSNYQTRLEISDRFDTDIATLWRTSIFQGWIEPRSISIDHPLKSSWRV
ncbi:MAG: hypothetical protein CM1200mP39_11110 [Dehalococcoidia bacterium]|nr:MAG: hypothetical protein CM1200mP39_11110 [Dehalococcoidia bacterium]